MAASIGRVVGAKGLLIRVYLRLPEMDTERRESDARMVDDELRREEQLLEDRAAEIEGFLGVRLRLRVAVGDDPADGLLEAVREGTEEKTLIAVGRPGLDAIQRIRLGSVSTKMMHAAKGPVLVCLRQRS